MHNESAEPLDIQPIPFPGFTFPLGGRVAIVRDEPVEQIVNTINEQGVEAVTLNCALGWQREDVSFLAQLPGVKNLSIITSDISGLSALEQMASLEELNLTAQTKEIIDFTQLTKLRDFYLYWWPGAASIFHCHWVTSAYFDKLKLNDYSPLGQLQQLEQLTIANSPIPFLDWLTHLPQLKELYLFNCRNLSDFTPISQLKQLRKIHIEGCNQLNDLTFISSIQTLEECNISGNGELLSVSPLITLKNLKVLFIERSSTITDGDLTPLTQLPKLAILSFRPKKHYSHKLVKKWKWADLEHPDVLLKPSSK